ncbi:MAG: diguanylate cyclase [Actinomycetota bacterium]|nr:diguanylate cyclase [Actinomycetota bacterium]
MTFHGRLRLFFTIIVIVPMVAIAAVLFTLTATSERGQVDAGIATGLRVSRSLYEDGRKAAADDLRRVAFDRRLISALSSGDDQATRARLRQLVRADPKILSARLSSPQGRPIARAGARGAVAPASSFLDLPRDERRLGTLSVSVTDGRALVRSAARRTRLDFLILRDGRAVATTVPGVRMTPKGSADFDVGGREYRGRREPVGKAGGVTEELVVFREAGGLNSAITESRVLIGAIIVAFLLLALATSVFVVRALQGQIGQFLSAARRLASGRFDQPVRTEGSDEFAELGREFNRMSEQLEAKSEQLEAKIREVDGQRRQLEETIRRVGKALSAGLDPQGVLDLTVQTALEACAAEAARALPIDRSVLAEIRAGSRDPGLMAALELAERTAFSIGPETAAELAEMQDGGAQAASPRGPVAIERDGVHALAVPLRAQLDSPTFASHVGVISIARRRGAFSRQQAELLQYLARQAEVSIENADLHATVQRQAVTDELVGLSNRRQMDRALDRELERRRRFEAPIGLVLLDIDDFKRVNDTYGHPQGDEVLIAVAGVLRDRARDVDEPARWGGEEFAVVLPGTDLEGAARLAEEMRERIERLRVPRLDADGDLRVTASFGVASVPASATHKKSLFDAAFKALSRAKRAGKNRVQLADDDADDS